VRGGKGLPALANSVCCGSRLPTDDLALVPTHLLLSEYWALVAAFAAPDAWIPRARLGR
jgi:hypothetical protein